MAAPQTWNIRWSVPFQSLEGINYSANIYEWAYSGSPITLKAAPQPFITQEDDSDDIFRPVRVQTGYLRVVLTAEESSYLEQLIPANNTEKLVRLSHVEENTTIIDWQGFIQTQLFSQPWDGGTRMIEIPLNSMLASLEHKRVPTSLANSGTIRTLGVITTALQSLGEDLMSSALVIDDSDGEWMRVLVDKNAFFGSNVEQEENYTIQTQQGVSWLEAVEMVCETFGIMARENGPQLVLAQYDNTAELTSRSLTWSEAISIGAGTAEPHPATSGLDSSDLLSVAEWRGVDNQMSYIPGANKVEVDFAPANVGNFVLMAAPNQDLEDIETKELKLGYPAGIDGSVWVQSSERNYANEDFINKGLHHDEQGQPSTYEDITAEQCRQGFSVLGTGYMPPPPYLINWGTGAWPCIFGNRKDAKEKVDMRPGIFLQQLSYESTYPMQNVYSLMSAGSVFFKNGSYINIQMSHHYFQFSGFGEIDEQGTMGAKDVYYDGDGVTSQLMIVLELSINVGTKAFQSQRNLTQTMQDLIDNNLDNYGKGSWVESGGRDIYTFCIGFKGTDMIYNSVEENNFISYDGGFLIPVTQDMTGRLIVKIRNVFTMNYETLGNYTSRIIEGFQVSLLQTAPSFYSDNTTNKYKRNFDNNFKAEITKSLKLGTIKINQPSPALLLTENGYLKTLPYNPSAIVNERPETHLLGRMSEYYNIARHTYHAEIRQGLDMVGQLWTIGTKTFFGIIKNHNWEDDNQIVKFIEIKDTIS